MMKASIKNTLSMMSIFSTMLMTSCISSSLDQTANTETYYSETSANTTIDKTTSTTTINTDIQSKTTNQTDDEILNIMENMSTYEKVCQLFIVTPEQLVNADGNEYSVVTVAGEVTKSALEDYPIGGIIYFSQNAKDRQQIIDMNTNLQEYSKYGLFISVDEEGGSISRLAKNGIEGVTPLNDMSWYGSQDNSIELVSEVGNTLGTELKELGFNLDFAPVADIDINPNNTMGERLFSSDPNIVADLVSAEVVSMQNAGVCATLKHFPGLGATETDTHYGSAILNRTYEELSETEFIPFQSGIDAGVDCIMVSHAIATGIGETEPSDLSYKVVTEILRNQLNFKGITITDAHTGMESITDEYTSEEATIKSIEAGMDIVLMPDDLNASIDAVLTAYQNDEEMQSKINDSVYRILSIKKKYGIL